MEEGEPARYTIDRDYNVQIEIEMSARSIDYLVVEADWFSYEKTFIWRFVHPESSEIRMNKVFVYGTLKCVRLIGKYDTSGKSGRKHR